MPFQTNKGSKTKSKFASANGSSKDRPKFAATGPPKSPGLSCSPAPPRSPRHRPPRQCPRTPMRQGQLDLDPTFVCSKELNLGTPAHSVEHAPFLLDAQGASACFSVFVKLLFCGFKGNGGSLKTGGPFWDLQVPPALGSLKLRVPIGDPFGALLYSNSEAGRSLRLSGTRPCER